MPKISYIYIRQIPFSYIMANPLSLAPDKTLACDRPGSLLTMTLRLIDRDSAKRSRTQLAHDLGIPAHWLNSFVQGAIDAPNVNRIQFIYEALSGKELV